EAVRPRAARGPHADGERRGRAGGLRRPAPRLHAEGPRHPSGRRQGHAEVTEGASVNGEVRREWFDKDYYQVLGVPKNASASDIKKAYRKLAQKHHPDANAGNKEAEDRFKEISAAYDVIGDVEKRKSYDRVREMGAQGFGASGPGGPGGWPGGAGTGWPGGVRY